ncbi:hypothetical protein LMG27174_03656 [Paraburkholderia rhynchosiae]|uniref:Uncharacterized protein n=1 Tax=Paraburkholderia rhynchosiae TaxID=487049 RepID=A0A6J5BC68_9BURK|nr:hypothetical protein LMG27174_03656 [Paraburkholderia rhynchosiae]
MPMPTAARGLLLAGIYRGVAKKAVRFPQGG